MNLIPLATSAGPRRAAPPAPLVQVLLDAEELRLFVRFLDAESASAEAHGDFVRADRLATRAAGLRR
jgi:hypothetical protein